MSKKIVCLLMLITFTALASFNETAYASVNKVVSVFTNTTAPVSNNNATTASPNTVPVVNDVTITCYNAVKSQCSGNPLMTASGRKIDLKKLNRGELRYLAVSRDLLKIYNYGDTVEVFISEGHPYNGKWLVADTMHKRWTNKIDLLLSTKQKLGKWQGQLQKVQVETEEQELQALATSETETASL